MLFPWTDTQWQHLTQRVRDNNLPHAMLFTGMEGLGKRAVAFEFASSLLCEQPDEKFVACQTCRSCNQIRVESHPDFHLVEPEEAGKSIKIDQIRELIEQFSLTSHYQRHRVAIIDKAERMTLAAANSLLKSLEEPPEKTLIILICASSSALPATIVSRCQKITYDPPGLDMALNWLKKEHSELAGQEEKLLAMANQAPLKAVEISDSGLSELRDEIFAAFLSISENSVAPLSITAQWLKGSISPPIQWIDSWICDLVKLKNRLGQAIVNRDKLSDLQRLAERLELDELYRYHDKLLETLRQQNAPLNAQMILDDLLLDWQCVTLASAGK